MLLSLLKFIYKLPFVQNYYLSHQSWKSHFAKKDLRRLIESRETSFNQPLYTKLLNCFPFPRCQNNLTCYNVLNSQLILWAITFTHKDYITLLCHFKWAKVNDCTMALQTLENIYNSVSTQTLCLTVYKAYTDIYYYIKFIYVCKVFHEYND